MVTLEEPAYFLTFPEREAFDGGTSSNMLFPGASFLVPVLAIFLSVAPFLRRMVTFDGT